MPPTRQLSKEFIKQSINAAIIRKELMPGERIVETRIARELNVSQSPVREALRELEFMGVIETIPYRGAFVKGIQTKDVIDSYMVRMNFEKMALEGIGKGIPEKSKRSLLATEARMNEAAANGNLDAYLSEDVKFHRLIIELSNNMFLRRLWDQCQANEWTRIGTLFSNDDLVTLEHRHKPMAEAIANENEKEALDASAQHWLFLIDYLRTTDE